MNLERVALWALGLYVAKQLFEGADVLNRNVVQPIKKFVGPSQVPPGPLQAKLLAEIDKFKTTGYLDDEIKSARAAIANNLANVDQKVAAALVLQNKIDQAEGFGFGDRVADVKAALHEYMQKELGPEASRVRLQG